ncbi:MAG: leucine--tRNA ligase [Patescibacteria group bacterium]|nr:leucine--tRNA ligase [Patescibacteria group bacterium]
MGYNPQKIERKWQRIWEEQEIYRAKDFSKKPKLYLLVEFPYPSGEGLHVGHCRSYVALDIVARKRRMEGFNVLFPMGWDAFGLPTENYAIKTGVHPREATKKNTANFKRQEKNLGLSFDWTREILTTDPVYYKWTQWIFLELFKNGLAYKKKMPINWCPVCKIGLANEEVVEGKCERCGSQVARKEKEQWLLKITEYADRLIDDLEKVDYPEKVKILQRDWIGRSVGTEVKFQVSSFKFQIPVFTTRIDTIFGCTYLVIAPEHPFLRFVQSNSKFKIQNSKLVKEYIERAKKKPERERLSEAKEKTGIELKRIKAINPVTSKEIPIFVADYVLPHYGTGAVMAVPCHDERDFQFARTYNLPMVEVIKNKKLKEKSFLITSNGRFEKAYEGEGILVNSGRFNGLKSEVARERIFQWLKNKGQAQKAIHYKLRDWIFSRQRYWGEPIPLVFCEKCGWVAVPDKDLPIKLPQVKDYLPTKEGESPLAKAKKWVETRCPRCQGLARRETDVMPNWAGSNWYYVAYTMKSQKSKVKSQNYNSKVKTNEYIWDKKKIKYWLPVDWYNGGMEHATLHLLYSRFIYKFLWDIGAVPKSIGPEPYKKRTSHGIILGERGIKMSKSKGNVINPDEVIREQGADTMRVYEMFMGPFEQAIAWDQKGVKGARRFLEKVWRLFEKSKIQNPNVKSSSKSKIQNLKLKKLLHKTIKKVSEDIENMKFNTAISALMILVNRITENRKYFYTSKDGGNYLKTLLLLLAPFAPHLTEEIWQKLGYKKSIFLQKWPKYDPKLIIEEKITLVVQVNGKVRDKIEIESGLSEGEAKKIALARTKIKKWIDAKKVKKTIFIKDKLINFVI